MREMKTPAGETIFVKPRDPQDRRRIERGSDSLKALLWLWNNGAIVDEDGTASATLGQKAGLTSNPSTIVQHLALRELVTRQTRGRRTYLISMDGVRMSDKFYNFLCESSPVQVDTPVVETPLFVAEKPPVQLMTKTITATDSLQLMLDSLVDTVGYMRDFILQMRTSNEVQVVERVVEVPTVVKDEWLSTENERLIQENELLASRVQRLEQQLNNISTAVRTVQATPVPRETRTARPPLDLKSLNLKDDKWRELVEHAYKWGFTPSKLANNHIQMIPPDKTKQIVVLPCTPSDKRSYNNAVADLRRSGMPRLDTTAVPS